MTLDKQSYYFIFGSFILIFLMLSPVLVSGYIGDDALNSLIPGYLQEGNTDVLSFSISIIHSWIVDQGRFFPIAFLWSYSLFSLISDLFTYKLFLIAAVLLNTLLFFFLIRLLTQSDIIAIFSVMISPIFFKITLAHNPILSFNALVQLVLVFFFFSLIVLIKYFQTQKKYFLMTSVILYFFCILTYEIAIPLILIYILVIANYEKEKSPAKIIKISFPYLSVTFVSIAIPIIFRLYYGLPIVTSSNTSIYSINPNLLAFISSLVKDLTGVVPLSYIVFDPHKIFGKFPLFSNSIMLPVLLCIGAGSFFLFFEISKRIVYGIHNKTEKPPNIAFFSMLGISLLVLPLLITAITYRHQGESVWGYTYLPGFISAFGAIIGSIVVCYYIFSKISVLNNRQIIGFLFVFSLIFSMICVIAFSGNSVVVEYSNADWLYPRHIIEDGMAAGLFSGVQNNSILLIDDSHYWDRSSFYKMHTGIQFDYIGSPSHDFNSSFINEKIAQSGRTTCSDTHCQYSFSDSKPVYYLKYYSDSKNDGIAILCPIKDALTTDQKILGITTNQIKLYRESPVIPEKSPKTYMGISGRWKDVDEGSAFQSFTMNEDEMTLLSKGNNGEIFSINSKKKYIDPLSLLITSSNDYRESVLLNWSPFQNSSDMSQGNSSQYDNSGVFRIKFVDDNFGKGISFKPLSLSDNFTIQALVKPATTKQVPFAAILGNHPGYNDYEGFVIQNEGQDYYTFSFGNGKSWEPTFKFHLSEEKWEYLVVSKEDKRWYLYLNGVLAESRDIQGSLKNSDMPLYIGNWIYDDRQFKGSIREVQISNSSISYEEIKGNWISIPTDSL